MRLTACAVAPAVVLTFLINAGCGSSFSSTTNDGGTDGMSDVRAPTEAGAREAGDSGHVDASQGWCATQGAKARFCADFDEGSSVPAFLASWTSYEQNQGSFGFDSAMPPSAPNALRATGEDGAQVLVVESFPPLSDAPASVRLDFDFRINNPGKPALLAAAGIAAIAYGMQPDDGYVALAIGYGPALVAISAGPGGTPFMSSKTSAPLPMKGVWAGRFGIAITYSKSSGTSAACLHVYQGPSEILMPCMPLPEVLAEPRVLSVALGDYVGGEGSSGMIDVEFDNVTYEVNP